MKQHGDWLFPDADDFMWRELQKDGSYQRSHLDAAMTYVTDRRCAIDGGAHVGQFAKPMAALFDRVIAVEPAADSAACLSANLARFGVINVDIKPVALGAHVGSATLELDAKQSARKNTGGRYVVSGGSIPVERIDDWNLAHLDLLKLDVEGSEPFALEGAAETLKRCQPIVLFESKEFWSRYGLPADAPQQLLESLGYMLRESVGRDEIWGPA